MAGVIVVGPRSLLRVGLVSLLATIGFEPIEEADDFLHITGCTAAKPFADVLVICLVRQLNNIIDRVGEIKAWRPTARIVFVVPNLDIEVMTGCFAAGAQGYLLETISRDALRESLKLVSAGEKVFPSELASLFRMFTKFENPRLRTLAPPESELSCREIEILQCLTVGQSNKVIARSLSIAEATVKVHVKRILRKAGVVNRTQAALWAVSTGLVGVPATRGMQLDGSSNRSQVRLRDING
jgi:two-component system nitrate/nitrite response regulator NarL